MNSIKDDVRRLFKKSSDIDSTFFNLKRYLNRLGFTHSIDSSKNHFMLSSDSVSINIAIDRANSELFIGYTIGDDIQSIKKSRVDREDIEHILIHSFIINSCNDLKVIPNS